MKRIPDDCTVRMTDALPLTVGGFVCESPDGHRNVYLNARLTRARQLRSIDHEFRHVKRDDLHNDRPIREVEAPEQPANGLLNIPGLMRARDLAATASRSPAPTPPPEITPDPPTPYQLRVLAESLATLDRAVGFDDIWSNVYLY